MQVEWAAHVDHKVTHDSNVGQIGLGIAGVIVAAVVVASTAPASITAAVVFTAAGTVGSYGKMGMDLGKVVDGFIGRVEAGKIVTGLPTVKLGPALRDAARAFTDSTTDCHSLDVAQGSLLVMLGPERRPMSRRGDNLRCASGKIAEGLKTLFVGGASSEVGMQVPDRIVAGMASTFTWLGIIKSVGTGNVRASTVAITQQALQAGGYDDAATVVGLAGMKPPRTSSPTALAYDAYRMTGKLQEGAAAAVNLAGGLVAP